MRTIAGAADGSAVATVMSRVSSAVRLTKTIVPPSAENDGALPVIVAILPSGIDSTLNVAGVDGSARSSAAAPARPFRRLCRHGRPGARVVKRSAVPVELMAPMTLSVRRPSGPRWAGGAHEVDLARAGATRGRREEHGVAGASDERRGREVPGLERRLPASGDLEERGARRRAAGGVAAFQYAIFAPSGENDAPPPRSSTTRCVGSAVVVTRVTRLARGPVSYRM